MEKKRVCIVGAGPSGLGACRHLLSKGFSPIVLEAGPSVGGVWARTIASTRLQTPSAAYRYSDFPWPESITETYPTNMEVAEYLHAYAVEFGVLDCIRFGARVLHVDYVGPDEKGEEEDLMWGGTGEAFGGGGVWYVNVDYGNRGGVQVLETDFLILAIGRFSGIPNIPTFPRNEGPEAFEGRVVHSREYSDMGSTTAHELIKEKHVTVIGAGKSAIDIAAECANINGTEYPCTMIYRSWHWTVPDFSPWGISFGYLYLNRFSQLLFHKPGEGFFLSLVATLLSPLAWLISKFVESYFKFSTPMKKYKMIPNYSIFHGMSSCLVGLLPDKFFNMVERGSIVLKKSKTFRFCKEAVKIDDETLVDTDVVILATGFKSDQKLRDMFSSSRFREIIAGSKDTIIPLYRDCVHPQIPQLAVVGYTESASNIFTSELQSKWLAHFLYGSFRLPSIKNMEASVLEWEKYMKRYNSRYRGSCVGILHIWYADQLCRDIGRDRRRSRGLFAEWFLPYGPTDYTDI